MTFMCPLKTPFEEEAYVFMLQDRIQTEAEKLLLRETNVCNFLVVVSEVDETLYQPWSEAKVFFNQSQPEPIWL